MKIEKGLNEKMDDEKMGGKKKNVEDELEGRVEEKMDVMVKGKDSVIEDKKREKRKRRGGCLRKIKEKGEKEEKERRKIGEESEERGEKIKGKERR